MYNKLAKDLLDKYLKGECNNYEKAIVETWYNQLSQKEEESLPRPNFHMRKRQWKGRLSSDSSSKGTKTLWKPMATVAYIILFIFIGLYLKQKKLTKIATSGEILNIGPGSNKAYLTLADGRKILLADSVDGKLAQQAGVEISKSAHGQLIYTIKDNSKLGAKNSVTYNTIETPAGGQYQVQLPDGIRVWLNAASSMKYPVSFRSLHERRVELNGEGYFEVAHNPSLPFRVVCHNQTVEVLGTHFNINSYADEASVKTTLLEGSVKVFRPAKGDYILLKPGQQSSFNANSSEISLQEVDPDFSVARKNGYFMFDNEKLGHVMRKLAKWYNVKTEYASRKMEDGVFYGTMSRYANISDVLSKLEIATDSNFSLEGNIVKVFSNQKSNQDLIKK